MKYIQTDIEAEEEMLEPLTGFLLFLPTVYLSRASHFL